MMGRLAWPKMIFQNRRTIFKLAKTAMLSRRMRPRNSNLQTSSKDVAAREISGEVNA
jgi:hypothetical protein